MLTLKETLRADQESHMYMVYFQSQDPVVKNSYYFNLFFRNAEEKSCLLSLEILIYLSKMNSKWLLIEVTFCKSILDQELNANLHHNEKQIC